MEPPIRHCDSRLSKKNSENIGYSTLCKYLHRWGFRLVRLCPMPAKADPEKQAAFIQSVQLLIRSEDPVLWFQDETAIRDDTGSYWVWARQGEYPLCPRTSTHLHANLFGVVRPEDGYFFGAQVNHGNASMFQLFLDLLQDKLIANRRNILILDNTRFHHAKCLRWGKLEPLYLSRYSPNLNPIENLWLRMKMQCFNGWYATSEKVLSERLSEVLDLFSHHHEWIQITCATTTYL